MKRLTRARSWLVLLASIGIGTGALVPAVLAADQVQIAQTQAESAVDRAISEGIEFVRRGNTESAIAAFEQAVSLDENSAAAQYNLGLALRQNDQLQASATAFWKADRKSVV